MVNFLGEVPNVLGQSGFIFFISNPFSVFLGVSRSWHSYKATTLLPTRSSGNVEFLIFKVTMSEPDLTKSNEPKRGKTAGKLGRKFRSFSLG